MILVYTWLDTYLSVVFQQLLILNVDPINLLIQQNLMVVLHVQIYDVISLDR